jgi:hypothetical protein
MSKVKSLVLVTLTAILAVCISSPVWATGEEPPPETPCVNIEKVCQDGGSPMDPISFDVTLSNCGDVMLYCNVKDLITHEIIINGPLPPGESVGAAGSYYPEECGESTNQVKAQCSYQLEQGVILRIYDEAEATCSVPCDGGGGCTLTPGYWKTHSRYGPAPYDATWAMIGEDTPFFLSGMSFYDALWEEPKGGHAYYILAHAYIAAQLNVVAGTSIPSDVAAAFDEATGLFGIYAPEAIGALEGDDPLRQTFIGLAEMLDDYNNGLSGPGHCNDEEEDD